MPPVESVGYKARFPKVVYKFYIGKCGFHKTAYDIYDSATLRI